MADPVTSDGGGATYATAQDEVSALAEIARGLRSAAAAVGAEAVTLDLAAVEDRLASDELRVVVVGEIKSGKSSLVNALLGDHVLPVRATPATAVLTEVRWGETLGARLWRAGEGVPTDVDAFEVDAHLLVDFERPDEQSPYVRAEISGPFPLCREGLVLVDSPGLNEAVVRQELTLAALTDADAVVVVQRSISAMTMSEQRFVERYLESFDPFFVFTGIDMIDGDERALVERDVKGRLRDARPDLADDRIFFVNARAVSRESPSEGSSPDVDDDLEAFATQLEAHLVSDTHRAKVLVIGRQVRAVARELSLVVEHRRALLTVDRDELARRYDDASGTFRSLAAEVEAIQERTQGEFAAVESFARHLFHERLLGLADEAPAIIEQSTPGASLQLVAWSVRQRAERVADEIIERARRELSSRLAAWVASTLQPAIARRLETLVRDLDLSLADFGYGLADVQHGLGGDTRDVHARDSEALAQLSRADRLSLDDVTTGLVAASVAQKAYQVTVPGGLLSSALALGPLVLPVTGALFVAGLWQGSKGLSRIEGRVQKMIADELTDQIRRDAPGMADQLAHHIRIEILAPIGDAVESGLSARLDQVRSGVASALEVLQRGSEEIERWHEELHQVALAVDDATWRVSMLIAAREVSSAEAQSE